MDEEIKRAIRLGEKNAEVLRLAHNWCSLLRVEQWGGRGMIEEMYGLPVGMRGFTCVHAKKAGSYGANVEMVAIEFATVNCIECPHRQPVTIPNLGTLLAERADEATRAAQHIERARVKEEANRDARAVSRRAARQTSTTHEERIAIDAIDAFDQNPSQNVDRLLQVAEALPGAFSEANRTLLRGVGMAELGQANSGSTLAGNLRSQGVLQVLRLLADNSPASVELALAMLQRGPDESAATIVLKSLPVEAETTSLVGCARSLILMASPSRDPLMRTGEQLAQPAFLIAFFDHHPTAVERAFRDLLQDEWKGTRIRAVDAAVPLCLHSESFLTWVLPELRRAMSLPDDSYNEGPCRGAVAVALAQLLPLYSAQIDAFIRRVTAEEAGEIPDTLFDAYTMGMTGRGRSESLLVGSAAFDVCLDRIMMAASPSSSVEVMRKATRALKEIARSAPSSLLPACDRLVGAAVMLSEARRSHTRLPVDPRIEFVSAMEDDLHRTTLWHCARDLASAAATVALSYPADIIPVVDAVARAVADSDCGLSGDLISALGVAVRNHQARALLIPITYWAITHNHQVLRSAGQQLYGALLDAGGGSLPSLLHEVALLGLTDSFVIVHTAAIAAHLRGEVPKAFQTQCSISIFSLADCYAKSQGLKETDARNLLRLVESWSDRLETIGVARARADGLLLGILSNASWGYAQEDLLRQLSSMHERLSRYARYWELVFSLAEQPYTVEHHGNEWLQAVSSAPVTVREPGSEAIWKFASAATKMRMDYVDRAVEILTIWGRHDEADRLAKWREQTVPADQWQRIRRSHAALVSSATSIERAIAKGGLQRAMDMLPAWDTALREAQLAKEEYRASHDVR